MATRVLRGYRNQKLSTRGMAKAFRRDHCLHVNRERVRLALIDMDRWIGELERYATLVPDAKVRV